MSKSSQLGSMILDRLPRLPLAVASRWPSTCSLTTSTLHMQLFVKHSHLQACRASAEWPLAERYNLSLLRHQQLFKHAFRAFAGRPSRASFEHSISFSHNTLLHHNEIINEFDST